jgi:hypothetical protein
VTRYVPSRHYLQAGLAAVLLGAFSAWFGLTWPSAYAAAGLFFASAAVLVCLSRRPAIEIHDTHLAVGCRTMRWPDIRRLDHMGWMSPLLVRVALSDGTHFLLIYPGDAGSAINLLEQLRRLAREALIDGNPYQKFWNARAPEAPQTSASSKYRLLLPEDEAEVERLYQRLKTVRHLDLDNSSDEK